MGAGAGAGAVCCTILTASFSLTGAEELETAVDELEAPLASAVRISFSYVGVDLKLGGCVEVASALRSSFFSIGAEDAEFVLATAGVSALAATTTSFFSTTGVLFELAVAATGAA